MSVYLLPYLPRVACRPNTEENGGSREPSQSEEIEGGHFFRKFCFVHFAVPSFAAPWRGQKRRDDKGGSRRLGSSVATAVVSLRILAVAVAAAVVALAVAVAVAVAAAAPKHEPSNKNTNLVGQATVSFSEKNRRVGRAHPRN